jgi:hypothetical protein
VRIFVSVLGVSGYGGLQNNDFVNPPNPPFCSPIFEAPEASPTKPNSKKFIYFISLLCILFFAACSDDDTAPIGTISFTSTHDCDFRLFDSHGRQVARDQYEVGKPPTVITMKSSGAYIVQATNDEKTVNQPFAYPGGNMNYYIEF